jgi:hypothetical protein
MSTLQRFAAASLAAALGLAWAPAARAQDTPKDDALERLLEKARADVDAPKADPGEPDAPEAKADEPGKADEGKPGEKAGSKPLSDDALDRLLEKAEGDDPKAKEDDALERLLEGYDKEGDAPEARGKPTGEARPGEAKPEDAASLDEGQKKLDARLEEILGRIKKKDQDEQDGEASGPLADAIKKMDDVEKKLGQKDTGETTRGEQKEIVKQLEQMIKVAKVGSSRGKGRRQKGTPQEGQPGQQPGDANGNAAQGVGPQMPKAPDLGSILAEAKDAWGHLPPELRAEMENVLHEEALPSRAALIDRYYRSINKKSVHAEE